MIEQEIANLIEYWRPEYVTVIIAITLVAALAVGVFWFFTD